MSRIVVKPWSLPPHLDYPSAKGIKFFKPKCNFGDNLNQWIYYYYTGKKLTDEYLMAGSIMRFCARKHVWGSGIGSPDEPRPKPKKIHAVRGKLTAALMRESGYECPEVYGDPVLLLPRFFHPPVKKQFQIGWIPQKRDTRVFGDVLIHPKQIDPRNYLRTMLACDVIVSSSLHGLVVADAYGIPNVWLWTDTAPCDFKWRDYYSAVDLEVEPIHEWSKADILRLASVKPKPDLRLLEKMRPFECSSPNS